MIGGSPIVVLLQEQVRWLQETFPACARSVAGAVARGEPRVQSMLVDRFSQADALAHFCGSRSMTLRELIVHRLRVHVSPNCEFRFEEFLGIAWLLPAGSR